MASSTDIDRLRRLLGNVSLTDISDADLGLILDNNTGSFNAAGYEYWLGVAASYVTLVNVTENGSSRSMGQAHEHAMRMVAFFKGMLDTETPGAQERTTTRAIVRP